MVKKIKSLLFVAVSRLFKNMYIAAVAGVILGVIIYFFNLWNILEPIIGIATLTVALGAAIKVSQNLKFQGEQFKTLADMDKKGFEITFGLHKGYAIDGGEFSFEDATGFIQEWMKERIKNNLPVLTGKIGFANLVYPVRNTEDGNRVTVEPSISYSGILSPVYDKNRKEEEIIQTLNDLAEFVGKKLDQKRVYLSFRGKSWVIDNKK